MKRKPTERSQRIDALLDLILIHTSVSEDDLQEKPDPSPPLHWPPPPQKEEATIQPLAIRGAKVAVEKAKDQLFQVMQEYEQEEGIAEICQMYRAIVEYYESTDPTTRKSGLALFQVLKNLDPVFREYIEIHSDEWRALYDRLLRIQPSEIDLSQFQSAKVLEDVRFHDWKYQYLSLRLVQLRVECAGLDSAMMRPGETQAQFESDIEERITAVREHLLSPPARVPVNFFREAEKKLEVLKRRWRQALRAAGSDEFPLRSDFLRHVLQEYDRLDPETRPTLKRYMEDRYDEDDIDSIFEWSKKAAYNDIRNLRSKASKKKKK